MKRMIRIRNSVILVLSICIVLLGIGFIVLSVRLKHKNDEVHSFDVGFIEVKKSSSVKGSTIEPIGDAVVFNQKKEIHFSFTLHSVHDEIVYLATIRNNGTLPAEIVDVLESPNFQDPKLEKIISPVTITLSDIKGKILQPGEDITLKISVYYNPSSSAGKKTFDYTIGLITKSRT